MEYGGGQPGERAPGGGKHARGSIRRSRGVAAIHGALSIGTRKHQRCRGGAKVAHSSRDRRCPRAARDRARTAGSRRGRRRPSPGIDGGKPLVRLVLAALSRPITVVVALIAVALCAILALRSMPVDIFPQVGDPAIYVAQPYGGMDPAQMEGYLTYYYEYHFLYITGIDHVESKSIQGATL